MSRKNEILRNYLTDDRLGFIHNLIQLVTMFFWTLLMSYTNSYYVIYLIIGFSGFYCRQFTNKKYDRANLLIASIFSLVLIAANYDMFSSLTKSIYQSLSIHKQFIAKISIFQFMNYKIYIFLLCLPVLFLGGMYLIFFILQFISEKIAYFKWENNSYNTPEKKIFCSAFLMISIFYLIIMLLGFYPGFFCPDTIAQVSEITSGTYSNRNPFYHTMVVRLFILLGIKVFNDINIGAALYSVACIAFVSSAFAYAVLTLYQLHINKKIILSAALIYMLMPYNIMFSFNMWKDTPFNAFILLFTVSIFRYLKRIGNNLKMNALILIASGMGVCLFRGNGLIVVFITLVFFGFMFGKSHRKMLISLASVLATALIMTYPVLNAMNVSQSDIVELSSMQIQQIARTVIENDDLTDNQKELISKVADIDKIKTLYTPILSDPLKIHLRSKGSQEYIKNHKTEYALLYLQLGFKHPKSYITAWIDQTRGYWNGGYDYVKFSYAFSDNQLGLKRTVIFNGMEKAVFLYCTLFEIVDLLKPFVSIGLHTWLILLVAFIGYRKKDKIIIFSSIPCLSIIFSLLFGTPVFSEFRYAYGLFCCLPFLAIAAFSESNSNLPHKAIINSSDNERKQA